MALAVEFLTKMLQDNLYSVFSRGDVLPGLICPSFPMGESSHKRGPALSRVLLGLRVSNDMGNVT